MKKATALLFLSIAFIAHKSIAQQKTKVIAHHAMKQTTITQKERDYAIKLLEHTEHGVFNAVKGLNEAQLNFKPADDKWSVADCVKHIAAAETTLWAMAAEPLNQPINPEKRADLKFTDEQLVKAVEDRTQKTKTFAALEPANSPYKTVTEALAAFKQNRQKLITFVKSTKQDLRNHVLVLQVGTFDAYQFILLIAAHSNRHTQQIDEVKDNINFPKS